MARPEKDRPGSLDEAVARLKRDPARPVQARIDDLDVELRVVRTPAPELKLGDFLAGGGGWQGESAEELIGRLREARNAGTSADPPSGR